MYRIFCLLSLFLFASGAFAQKYTVSGRISDGSSGEDLLYSTVLVKDKSLGTEANDYGFYSLTLDPGEYTLVYEYRWVRYHC